MNKHSLQQFGALSLLIGGLSLSACSNEEIHMDDARVALQVTSGIQTRAYDDQWEKGDLIGVSGMSGGVPYTNVQYETINGDGNFTISNPGNEIYFQDGNTVTFTAYYPWAEFTQDSPVIIADTRTQASQNTFDFLWSQQTGSKINPHVSFTFAHKMAKLVLTIKGGTDVSYHEVQRAVLSLRGFKNNGSFNVTDGTAAATDDDLTTDWTFAGNTTETGYNAPSSKDDAKGTVAYTLILFPQEFSAPLPITATLTGSQSFSATLDRLHYCQPQCRRHGSPERMGGRTAIQP